MLVLKGLQGKRLVLEDLQKNTEAISFIFSETSSLPFGDYLLNYKTIAEAIQPIQKILEEKNKIYTYIIFKKQKRYSFSDRIPVGCAD